jgi:hypothetical protein
VAGSTRLRRSPSSASGSRRAWASSSPASCPSTLHELVEYMPRAGNEWRVTAGVWAARAHRVHRPLSWCSLTSPTLTPPGRRRWRRGEHTMTPDRREFLKLSALAAASAAAAGTFAQEAAAEDPTRAYGPRGVPGTRPPAASAARAATCRWASRRARGRPSPATSPGRGEPGAAVREGLPRRPRALRLRPPHARRCCASATDGTCPSPGRRPSTSSPTA